jgi:hypothetical protein
VRQVEVGEVRSTQVRTSKVELDPGRVERLQGTPAIGTKAMHQRITPGNQKRVDLSERNERFTRVMEGERRQQVRGQDAQVRSLLRRYHQGPKERQTGVQPRGFLRHQGRIQGDRFSANRGQQIVGHAGESSG